MHLRRQFSNFSGVLRTLSFRWSQAVFEKNSRAAEGTILDRRGVISTPVGMAPTFLDLSEARQLAADYEAGTGVMELSRRYGVHRHTIARHLAKQGVEVRIRGLAHDEVSEAARLYESGLTLTQVGQEFGVSQQAVRRAIAAAGTSIRPQYRRRPDLS